MPITIDWKTKVINIPQNYLIPKGGTLYELDTNQFRLALKALEASEYGITNVITNKHNTQVSVGGITLARTLEIFNGYSVTFEDGQYSVVLSGSNNNIFDVGNGILNQNYVQVIPSNAAGLIVSGSGVTQQDKDDIVDNVWSTQTSSQSQEGTYGTLLKKTMTVGKFIGLK